MLKKIIIIAIFIELCSFTKLSLASPYFNKQLCSDPNYTCIRIKSGQTWDRLFPDLRRQYIVKKINRMNVQLTPGMIVAIPNELDSLDPLMFAPFPMRITPFDRTVIIIDLDQYAFAAYDTFGSLVYWGPVSAGQNWCPDVGRGCHTPTGSYYIQSKGGPGCISSKYPLPNGGAPMPYCMHFYGGYALHASTVPGYHASHGCIRLFYEDAKWLNNNFIETGPKKTKVIIQP